MPLRPELVQEFWRSTLANACNDFDRTDCIAYNMFINNVLTNEKPDVTHQVEGFSQFYNDKYVGTVPRTPLSEIMKQPIRPTAASVLTNNIAWKELSAQHGATLNCLALALTRCIVRLTPKKLVAMAKTCASCMNPLVQGESSTRGYIPLQTEQEQKYWKSVFEKNNADCAALINRIAVQTKICTQALVQTAMNRSDKIKKTEFFRWFYVRGCGIQACCLGA
jgi:hypothetical protein